MGELIGQAPKLEQKINRRQFLGGSIKMSCIAAGGGAATVLGAGLAIDSESSTNRRRRIIA